MMRNQTLSTDLLSVDPYYHKSRYHHQWSPRKSKSYQSFDPFAHSMFYKGKYEIAAPGSPESKWIGKKMIPWNGESLPDYVWQLRIDTYFKNRDWVHEYEIATFCQPRIYRIIFVRIDKNGEIVFLSQPNVKHAPGRINLLITPNDYVIRQVGYF